MYSCREKRWYFE